MQYPSRNSLSNSKARQHKSRPHHVEYSSPKSGQCPLLRFIFDFLLKFPLIPIPLTDYPQSLDLNNLHYCGSKSEPDIAEQMALGNVNIHTKVQVDNVRGAGGAQSSVTTEEEDEVVRAF